MITHIKKPGSYNAPLCGWDRKHPETTTVCTTGAPDCPDCLALLVPAKSEPFAMKRDKMCCDCEHSTRIRGVPWVKLCRLHAAAPDLLEAAKLLMAWADCASIGNNSRRCDSLGKLRAAIAKAEGRS